jgi:multiple sugar transport system permease protein
MKKGGENSFSACRFIHTTLIVFHQEYDTTGHRQTLVIPGVITAGLFAFLFAWGDFIYGLTLTTNNTIQPVSLSIYSYIGQFSDYWNDAMAVAVLASIPAALLLIVFQRYITAGLTAGAVKG